MHVNLDPETEQYRLARETAAAAPLLSGQITSRALALVPGPGRPPTGLRRPVAPGSGARRRSRCCGTGATSASRVELLEATDGEAAARYAVSIAAGQVQGEDYRGIEIATDQRGIATASIDGFLAIGRPSRCGR